MRILVLPIFALCVLQAAEVAKTETPATIPADRKEAVSMQMLKLQQAQLALQQLQIQAQQMLVKAEKAVQDEQQKYNDMEAALKREFHADACSLTIEKTWDCTPKKTADAPAPVPAAEPKVQARAK